MPDHASTTDAALAALHRFFVSEATIGEILTRVAELTKRALPQTDMAGLSMTLGGKRGTHVFTDEEAVHIDQVQYDTNNGPCIHAAAANEPVYLPSLAADDRFPEFDQVAERHGIVSTLSLPMTAQGETVGALNLYARTADAYPDEAKALAEDFARQAAFLLRNANAYWDARALHENLSEALQSRAVIEQAKGVITGLSGRSPEEAFDELVRRSQASNTKLRSVAVGVVEAAQRKGT